MAKLNIMGLKIISFAGKKNVVVTVFAMLIGGIAEVLGIGIIVTLAMRAINENGMTVNIFGFIFQLTKYESLGGALIIFFFRCAIYNIASNAQVRFSFHLHKKLSVAIYKNILESKEYLTEITSGKFVQEVITELHNYRDMYVIPLITVISEIIVALALVITIGLISIEILVWIMLALIFTILVNRLLNKNLNRLGGDRKKIEQQRIDLIKNTKSGASEILCYAQINRYVSKFDLLTDSVGAIGKTHAYGLHKLRSIQELILVAAILVIISGTLEAAQSVLVLFLLMRLISVSIRVNTAIQSINYTSSINNDVIRLLDKKSLQKIPKNLIRNELVQKVFAGYISLNKKTILYKNLPKFFNPGFFCVVGKSGVGKSQLGLGLVGVRKIWSPKGIEHTSMLLDGNIGFVPQESYIETETIDNNIIFGRTIDVGRIAEVKKLSNLNFSDEINRANFVSEDTLSGGQKKRISIARALYGSPKCLVLDEPTNNLDSETVGRLIETLFSLREKLTIICITHDQRLISIADEVFGVEAEIVEE
jgi:ABC-type multidrug transport system fused ATPase/permease subunit